MSCGVGRRLGLDLVLPWPWYRLAAAAPIGTLAWDLSYAAGATQKRKKKKKKKGGAEAGTGAEENEQAHVGCKLGRV